jgi:DNA-binding response OmpR family regulator
MGFALAQDDSRRPRRAHPARARTAPGGTDGRSFEVLLVEDDRDAATLLRIFMEKAGHRVATAATGPAALAVAAARTFDTVILDLGLPGVPGAEVLRELKTRPLLQRARFICLSGYREQDVDWRGLGFDHYLEKPASYPELERLLGPRHD